MDLTDVPMQLRTIFATNENLDSKIQNSWHTTGTIPVIYLKTYNKHCTLNKKLNLLKKHNHHRPPKYQTHKLQTKSNHIHKDYDIQTLVSIS